MKVPKIDGRALSQMSFAWPILVALLVALAFPPFGIWPLSWLAFVFFCKPLLELNRYSDSPQKLFRKCGLWFALYTFFVNIFGFYWLAYTLASFGNMPWLVSIPLVLLIFSLFSVLSFFVGALWPLAIKKVPIRLRPLVLLLWLLVWDAFDLKLFPWTPVMSVASDPLLLASVHFLGTWGWRFLFFSFAVTTAWSFIRFEKKQAFVRSSLALVIVFFVGYVSGSQARVQLKKQFSARQPVALIQGNIGNYEKKLSKLGVFPTVQLVLKIHDELIHQIAEKFAPFKKDAHGAEPWIAWPETSFPATPLSNTRDDSIAREWADETGGVHLLGTYENAEALFAGENKRLDFNIVALYQSSLGYVGRYRKIRRIPFGEFIPGDEWFPQMYHWLPAVNHFGKGDHFEALPHPDPHGPVFVPLVCYELLYPGFVTDFVADARARYPGRPLVLVNPSNDSWYGPTSEPYQNALLARWAVVAQGLPGLRPANTGISEIIAPWGEVMASGPRDQSLVIFGELPVEKTEEKYEWKASQSPSQ